jgi:hypothetical protein
MEKTKNKSLIKAVNYKIVIQKTISTIFFNQIADFGRKVRPFYRKKKLAPPNPKNLASF